MTRPAWHSGRVLDERVVGAESLAPAKQKSGFAVGKCEPLRWAEHHIILCALSLLLRPAGYKRSLRWSNSSRPRRTRDRRREWPRHPPQSAARNRKASCSDRARLARTKGAVIPNMHVWLATRPAVAMTTAPVRLVSSAWSMSHLGRVCPISGVFMVLTAMLW